MIAVRPTGPQLTRQAAGRTLCGRRKWPNVYAPDRAEGSGLADADGAPVSDGLLEVWQGDQFARRRTDAEGAYNFVLRKPAPTSGPDGRPHAPYFNVTVFARGLLRHLATRLYFPDEEAANTSDPVLAMVEPERRRTLIGRDDGGVLRFDVCLVGTNETVFFEL